jgi:hypothetical protein
MGIVVRDTHSRAVRVRYRRVAQVAVLKRLDDLHRRLFRAVFRRRVDRGVGYEDYRIVFVPSRESVPQQRRLRKRNVRSRGIGHSYTRRHIIGQIPEP